MIEGLGSMESIVSPSLVSRKGIRRSMSLAGQMLGIEPQSDGRSHQRSLTSILRYWSGWLCMAIVGHLR